MTRKIATIAASVIAVLLASPTAAMADFKSDLEMRLFDLEVGQQQILDAIENAQPSPFDSIQGPVDACFAATLPWSRPKIKQAWALACEYQKNQAAASPRIPYGTFDPNEKNYDPTVELRLPKILPEKR